MSKRPLLHRIGSTAAGIGREGSGNPRRRQFVTWSLVVVIFGALVAVVLAQVDKLPDYDWRFEPGWLAAAVAAVAFFYALQAELWRAIVRGLGEHLPQAPARAAWGKSLLARYVPTNVLLVVGRVVMAEKLGVPRRVTLASIVYELGIAMCAAVIVGSYFVVDFPDLEDEPARYAVLGVIPLALAALHPRVFEPLADWGLRKLGREPLPRVLRFRWVLGLTAGYALGWIAVGFGVYCFTSALHPVDSGDLAYLVASYPVAFCVAVFTFIVPSGLGTRDAALFTALDVVLPATVASAIAVGFRIFQVTVELLFVGAAVLLGRTAAEAEPDPANSG